VTGALHDNLSYRAGFFSAAIISFFTIDGETTPLNRNKDRSARFKKNRHSRPSIISIYLIQFLK